MFKNIQKTAGANNVIPPFNWFDIEPLFNPAYSIFMKLIPLTQGKFAMVDDEDFENLNQWKWQARKYATRSEYLYQKMRYKGRIDIQMHRVIMGLNLDEKVLVVDHKDGNGFNNQKSNLRICTKIENSRNRKLNSNKKDSIYKGVRKINNNWQSRIVVNGKIRQIGIYNSEIFAARSYDIEAVKEFGEFARTNNISNEVIPISTSINKTSKYKGVFYFRKNWVVKLQKNKILIYTSKHKTELEAGKAYNEAAINFLGDKAKLNKIED